MPEDLRRFGPKLADHPTVGRECPACHYAFKAGDFTTLVPLGPGNDPDEQDRARAGRPYTAVAAEVHWACATGELVELDGGPEMIDVLARTPAGNVRIWERVMGRDVAERRVRELATEYSPIEFSYEPAGGYARSKRPD